MCPSPSPSAEALEKESEAVYANPSSSSEVLAEAHLALEGLRDMAGQINAKIIPTVEEAAPALKPTLAEVAATPTLAASTTLSALRAGEIIRRVREEVGYSLDDVAAEVKIKPQYLQAIEEGRYNDLPSRTHAIGFVRLYAQAVGLNGEEVVTRFRNEGAKNIPPQKLQVRRVTAPVSESPLPGSALIALCLVLAVIVYFVGYTYVRAPVTATPMAPQPRPPSLEERSADAPVAPSVTSAPSQAPASASVAAAPASTPESPSPPSSVASSAPQQSVPETQVQNQTAVSITPPSAHLSAEAVHEVAVPSAPEAAPAPKPAAPVSRIRLEAAGDTDVQIFDGDGALIAERMIHEGEAFYVPDHAGYTLATSNAGALKIQVDGHAMPALGKADEAMHNIPLNPAQLLKYLQ
jgi:cytoskeleton protein RodZ